MATIAPRWRAKVSAHLRLEKEKRGGLEFPPPAGTLREKDGGKSQRLREYTPAIMAASHAVCSGACIPPLEACPQGGELTRGTHMRKTIRTTAFGLGLALAVCLPASAADEAAPVGKRTEIIRHDMQIPQNRHEETRGFHGNTRGRTINQGTSFDRDPRNTPEKGQERHDLGNLGVSSFPEE